ncbi:MAG: hypothetical protein E4H14_04790 [Candidatus Thorarchaeota archaeon]|nr:MAG: hypothetical protein E4H14_04790 [Candidatus Thorarchaeota archaeon]
MGKLLKITRDFKQDDFQTHELNWLKRCLSNELKGRISEDKIIFTPKKSYLMCTPSKEVRKDVPSRFLENKLLVESVSEQKLHNEFFVSLEVLFWYIENVNDVRGYKKLIDPLFYEVFHGDHVDYDKSKKGYRVLDKHLAKVLKGRTPIEKTVFIGYLRFLRLLKEKIVPPLGTINQELKDGIMKHLGLTQASRGSFGMVAHRQLLGVCWNCGDDDVLPNGLCSDCDEYWDEKTR